MKTIVTAPEDLEGKIDLRGRAQLHRISVHGMKKEDEISDASKRLIVALDFPTADQALKLVDDLAGVVRFFKIVLQLYTAAGPEIVRAVTEKSGKVFLDLKLHDIPNT